jgi:hypothetical protein
LFDSYHQPVAHNYTPAVALLTTAIIFVPVFVLFSQPVSYLPAIGVSGLCVVLALFHSRNTRAPLAAPVMKNPKDAR